MAAVSVQFKKILVALDGSEHALKALRYAVDISKRYEANVTLLHVVPRAVYIEGASAVDIESVLESYGKEVLAKGLEIAREASIGVDTKLVLGHPSDEIARVANTEGYDLVVVGSRGLSRVKAFLLGSVSDKVARYAKCPVLVVKP